MPNTKTPTTLQMQDREDECKINIGKLNAKKQAELRALLSAAGYEVRLNIVGTREHKTYFVLTSFTTPDSTGWPKPKKQSKKPYKIPNDPNSKYNALVLKD